MKKSFDTPVVKGSDDDAETVNESARNTRRVLEATRRFRPKAAGTGKAEETHILSIIRTHHTRWSIWSGTCAGVKFL